MSISANEEKKPKKSKQNDKTITGDAIVTNLTQHFTTIIDGAIAEKRRLVKTKDYKNKKGKKVKYVLNNGSLKVGKKADKGKNAVNVHYN